MNNLYIIVQTNKSNYNEQTMLTKNSDREVIHYAGILASRGGFIEIDRIFSIDEFGNVDHHVIQFKNGKLLLVEVPRQSK